ncbi:F-box only protein 47-like [Micropterus dolomieu]|uniref:F-box only protein 47-like n=1 Tax=Micropterus dolomieu TaxID=147949 RepID=UPI001E8CFAF3|nr:F-box only protein 47-like [Micropterus dolomieu]XP_045909063.1 F-box only protein 47-like [Micropterus dolomieu]XP_045909064.1 F-box only protein 47-like [Micropterus dolomieu]
MIMMRKASRNVGKYTLTQKSQQYKRTHCRARPARTIMTRSRRNVHSCGSFFHRLPSEVLHMILDKLSVLEISVFSMVSKEITRYLVDYISTLAWKNKMIVQSFHHCTCLEQKSAIRHYRDLGLLFKRCTLLLPTKDRLKFIFSQFSQIPCFMLEQCLAADCIGFSSYGVFLQTLIAGWDELECHRVFNFLCDLTNLLQKIQAVITGKPGLRWYQELQLRLFCRQVLLDPWPNQPECQFWLMQLLKPWPIVSQAHLLFIFYGPLLPEGTLGWQDVVERGLPHSALWDLARAILLLFSKLEVKDRTTTSMLAILEELIVIPQPWHVENVARLLVLCGNSLCYTVLASKAVNGRLIEISRLIVYIILVCEKDGYHMSWAVKLVQQICKVFSTAAERFFFIQQLESTFSEVTRQFFEFSIAENHFEDRETFQSLCILLDSSARFHTKFLHMFLK